MCRHPPGCVVLYGAGGRELRRAGVGNHLYVHRDAGRTISRVARTTDHKISFFFFSCHPSLPLTFLAGSAYQAENEGARGEKRKEKCLWSRLGPSSDCSRRFRRPNSGVCQRVIFRLKPHGHSQLPVLPFIPSLPAAAP